MTVRRRALHRASFTLAAIGLAGKVLGPVGLVQLIASGSWPLRSAWLCVTNDVIWWLPLGLYLYDSRARPNS